jgi:hypothetical protein
MSQTVLSVARIGISSKSTTVASGSALGTAFSEEHPKADADIPAPATEARKCLRETHGLEMIGRCMCFQQDPEEGRISPKVIEGR